jgi:sugar phosphate isomerase/epimerase
MKYINKEYLRVLFAIVVVGITLDLSAQWKETSLLEEDNSVFSLMLPTGNPEDFKVKTCLHSVSYAGFWRGQSKLTVDDFLEKARELGFDGVMLVAKRPHVSPLDYDDVARKKLRNKIDELGLELVCLAGYTDFTTGIDKPGSGMPNIEIQAVYVEQIAKLAHDLGTNIVRIFTGFERQEVSLEKQYEMVIKGLTLAGEAAAKYGITLAVQNHHDIGLHHVEMDWILKEVNLPNVRSAWDAWAPTLQGLDSKELRESVIKMKSNIVLTSTADYIKIPRYNYKPDLVNYQPREELLRAVPMGEGIIDYETFFNALKEIGYQGYIVYEMCSFLQGGGSIENLDKTAAEFINYVNKFD